MAERDLPAVFDKVLEVTSHRKFHVLGHSMGATVAYAFFSENHDYDDKVRLGLVELGLTIGLAVYLFIFFHFKWKLSRYVVCFFFLKL